jgi:Beta-ketoacyl synthase, N-terminal domain
MITQTLDLSLVANASSTILHAYSWAFEALSTSLQAGGMLTLDGRCKTLDVSADGYVRGEACIAAYAAFSEVPADAFPTAATALFSTFVNQDGRSSSLTAPNGPSQQQVGGKGVLSVGLLEWLFIRET